MHKPKIAIVVSHPIQHFCPMYASWAKSDNWTLKVFFASSTGVNKYFDPNFKKEISWNRLYLDKFDHEFLNDGKNLVSNKYLDAPELFDRLKNYEPDIVIVYGYAQKLQRRAKQWAIMNKKKVLMISDSELRHYRPWYVKLLKHFVIPRRLKGFDGFLTVGDANEEYYQHYGVKKEKLFRSPFPIDIFLYEKALNERDKLRKTIRNKYGIKEDEIVLSVVGKLVKWKSQIDLIKSLALQDNKKNKIILFIIGSGAEENTLKDAAQTLINNEVIFAGFVPPEELPAYYSATDIYIHPAAKEPHSLAISEAVYIGCPVVISHRCGSYGPTDDVRNDFNGFVYEQGDINALSQFIHKLSNNKELRRNFAENSTKIGFESQKLAHGVALNDVISKISMNT